MVVFDLYLLHNPDSPHGYPYVGISHHSKRIINICEEHIHILDREDTLFFESDYLPVYRRFSIDLTALDRLVNTYTGQDHYSLIARFNEVKHITLTYHSPTNESLKDYDIFTDYPSPRAQELIADVYPMMDDIRKEIFD